MPEPSAAGVALVLASFAFAFLNGWNDSSNAISMAVSTRVLSPGLAVLATAALNMLGALAGLRIAEVLALHVVTAGGASVLTVLAALGTAALWVAAASALGLPVSASHALIGGLVGAGAAYGGREAVSVWGLKVVLAAAVLGPLLAGLCGWAVIRVLQALLGGHSPWVVHRWFRRLQVVSAAALSLGHGSSDGQKVMGVLAMGLMALQALPRFEVPDWARLGVAAALGLGTLVGGWVTVVRSLGMRVLHIDPPSGFAAEAGSAALLLVAAATGAPVSSTHAVTGAVLGVGAATRLGALRWGIAGRVVWLWLLTLPGAAALAYGVTRFLAAVLR